eukprot:460283-Pelagomonas_calceolata.AAC.2
MGPKRPSRDSTSCRQQASKQKRSRAQDCVRSHPHSGPAAWGQKALTKTPPAQTASRREQSTKCGRASGCWPPLGALPAADSKVAEGSRAQKCARASGCWLPLGTLPAADSTKGVDRTFCVRTSDHVCWSVPGPPESANEDS